MDSNALMAITMGLCGATLFAVLKLTANLKFPDGDSARKQLSEVNRRLAVIMKAQNIEDDAVKALREFMQLKMDEAKAAVADLDEIMATKKTALLDQLKKIESDVLGPE